MNLDPEYLDEAREAFLARAEADGMVVCPPGPSELQLDIDDEADMMRHEAMWPIVKKHLELDDIDRVITPSRSGVGRHIRITVPWELQPIERIAYQAILGSDAIREFLSAERVRGGCSLPSVLVETAEVADQLRAA